MILTGGGVGLDAAWRRGGGGGVRRTVPDRLAAGRSGLGRGAGRSSGRAGTLASRITSTLVGFAASGSARAIDASVSSVAQPTQNASPKTTIPRMAAATSRVRRPAPRSRVSASRRSFVPVVSTEAPPDDCPISARLTLGCVSVR
jgi:hypothetical protein